MSRNPVVPINKSGDIREASDNRPKRRSVDLQHFLRMELPPREMILDDRQASNAGQGAVLAVGATGSGAVGGDDARQTLQGHVGA